MTPTILIVDDHAAFRVGVRALLAVDGYDVVGEAADGAAGLQAATELRPDVILLDVRLPDMDGFQVAGALAARGSTAAVVLTSSSDDPLYPERATCCGARGFVAKHDVGLQLGGGLQAGGSVGGLAHDVVAVDREQRAHADAKRGVVVDYQDSG